MVRTDQTLTKNFRESQDWGSKGDVQTSARVAKVGPDGERIIQSFSGHERNHLFLNAKGNRFDDVSALSGIDNEADSRAFALWDFDQDGWQDIVLTNANRPLLNWYRNEVGQITPERSSLSVKLIGGNKASKASSQWSSRDGYGAEITVVYGDKHYVREHRCGEGFAAQNSATMLIGTGNAKRIDRLEVRWPSGKSQTIKDLKTNAVVNVYENADDCPLLGQIHESRPRQPATVPSMPTDKFAALTINLTDGVVNPPGKDKYRVYVTTATWCVACTSYLPQISLLKDRFDDKLQLYGIPIDPNDNPAKLENYHAKNQPAYELVKSLTDKDKSAVSEMVRIVLGSDALPATFVTDPNGKYVGSFEGVPTASQIAAILSERFAENEP